MVKLLLERGEHPQRNLQVAKLVEDHQQILVPEHHLMLHLQMLDPEQIKKLSMCWVQVLDSLQFKLLTARSKLEKVYEIGEIITRVI